MPQPNCGDYAIASQAINFYVDCFLYRLTYGFEQIYRLHRAICDINLHSQANRLMANKGRKKKLQSTI